MLGHTAKIQPEMILIGFGDMLIDFGKLLKEVHVDEPSVCLFPFRGFDEIPMGGIPHIFIDTTIGILVCVRSNGRSSFIPHELHIIPIKKVFKSQVGIIPSAEVMDYLCVRRFKILLHIVANLFA